MLLQLDRIYIALLEDQAAMKRIKSSSRKALWYKIQKVVVHAVWRHQHANGCSHDEAIEALDKVRGDTPVDAFLRKVDVAITKSMMKPKS